MSVKAFSASMITSKTPRSPPTSRSVAASLTNVMFARGATARTDRAERTASSPRFVTKR